MTNEEKLQYAKDNYPIGTSMRSDYLQKDIYILESDEFLFSGAGIQCKKAYCPRGEYSNCSPYIYYNGKWAEIISSPIQKQQEVNYPIFN